MTTRLHHIHAAVVHAPLALIPGAAIVDVWAAGSGDRVQAHLGRKLWWYASASALVAGLAGMAASQEVVPRSRRARDTMWLHGAGNVTLLLGTFAMTAWRQGHRPTMKQSLLGLGAAGLAGYGSYLGGQLVYEHAAGVTPQGVGRSPRILSAEAPGAFVRDVIKGAWWLVTRARKVLREPRVARDAAIGRPAAGPPTTDDRETSWSQSMPGE
jgi:uncharacterized membrane protein